MTSPQQRPFATYLLPSLSLPIRRRQLSSASSVSSDHAVPSLSCSPTTSISTSYSSSPTAISLYSADLKAAYNSIDEAVISGSTNPVSRGVALTRTLPNTLRCTVCATDIALASQIVSKGFTGRHGRAYLVSPPSPSSCCTTEATSLLNAATQACSELINTKIGRSVTRELLTGTHVVADVTCIVCHSVLGWKYVDAKEFAQRYKIGKFILETKRVVIGISWEVLPLQEDPQYANIGNLEHGSVGFDSEDEDDCEDLFAGIWDADIAAKRKVKRGSKKPAMAIHDGD